MNVLPEELLTQILLQLPTITLVVTAKQVCRQWNSIISNPFFAKSQLIHRHIDYKDNNHLIFNHESSDYHKDFIMFTDTGDIKFKSANGSLQNSLSFYKLPLLVCNGLVLTIYYNHTVVQFEICNPILNQFVSLEPITPPLGIETIPELVEMMYRKRRFGFGFDRITNRYKVVMMTISNDCELPTSTVYCSIVDVVSEKKMISSWRRLDCLNHTLVDVFWGHQMDGIFLNGRLVWLLPETFTNGKVLLFDLHMEEFSFGTFEVNNFIREYLNEYYRLKDMMNESSVGSTFLSKYPDLCCTFGSLFTPCLLPLLPNLKKTKIDTDF